MNFIDRIRTEPVAVMALVEAVVFAVTEFGVDVTGGQQAAILGVVAAVLTLITRSSVTPSIKLEN